jgi:nucleotide-binding universal stress UspA family protein
VLKTILIALDSSDLATQVIEALNAFRVEPQTKIILSHVLSSPGTESELDVDRPHQSQESLYQQIEKQLQAYQLQFPGSELEIVSGDPAEELIRLANIYQADLIIIGTRGLKGVKRVIQGSVSSQVVADAPCSVFVVKP